VDFRGIGHGVRGIDGGDGCNLIEPIHQITRSGINSANQADRATNVSLAGTGDHGADR